MMVEYSFSILPFSVSIESVRKESNEENKERIYKDQSHNTVVLSNLRYVYGSHLSHYARRQEEESTRY